MKDIRITGLHCKDCADSLLKRLQSATGVEGFAYDADHMILSAPDSADMDIVHDVLDADKITICHYRTKDGRCACAHCVYDEPDEKGLEEAHEEAHILGHEHEHVSEHGHDRAHNHGHHHGGATRNIAVVFFMNLIFAVGEFILGAILNSTDVLADAVHDLGDAVSVGVSFFLEKKSNAHADRRYSFGHRRFSLLGALITGLVLIIGSFFALLRAVPRLIAPEPVNFDGLLYLALAAIALNAVSAWALHRGHTRNESMLNLHMLEDMLGWIAILIVSLILRIRPWYFLDPLVSVLISLFILYRAVPQALSALRIFMESVPDDINIEKLEKDLLGLPSVHGLSHLHVWSMDGEVNNFAVTLFSRADTPEKQRQLRDRVRWLVSPLHVHCSTVEISFDPVKRFTGRVA